MINIKRLRHAMIEKQMDQEALAKASFVSRSEISHILCGRRVPSVAILKCLCRALDVSADYLLDLDEEGT